MPSLRLDDTIAAISTPLGEGGIAVLRVSGKEAISIVAGLFRPSKREDLTKQPTHTIHHGHLVDEEGKIIDEILVSLFHSPRSYTGEDIVEVSCHGGIRVVRRILELLVEKGARHAEPGEFTKRAFLNGKLDLTQAEAVLDLIRARSDAALEAAIHQLQGKLSEKIQRLKEGLLKIYAHLEASLDFPDEPLEVYSRDEFSRRMKEIETEIQGLIATFERGALMREGILTVIVGRTNVGKSSLLNALVGRDRALTSEIPGTTRDALEETIEIDRQAVRLVDTAGLGSEAKDPLDQMGMERARRYLTEAHLVLFLMDGSTGWNSEDEQVWKEVNGKPFLPVVNKIDLPQKWNPNASGGWLQETPCSISCVTGEGILKLEGRIGEKIAGLGLVSESVTLTRLRHKQALEEALKALWQCRATFEAGESIEFVLVDLKKALQALQELVGEVYSEDLLDIVFQEFCIGK